MPAGAPRLPPWRSPAQAAYDEVLDAALRATEPPGCPHGGLLLASYALAFATLPLTLALLALPWLRVDSGHDVSVTWAGLASQCASTPGPGNIVGRRTAGYLSPLTFADCNVGYESDACLDRIIWTGCGVAAATPFWGPDGGPLQIVISSGATDAFKGISALAGTLVGLTLISQLHCFARCFHACRLGGEHRLSPRNRGDPLWLRWHRTVKLQLAAHLVFMSAALASYFTFGPQFLSEMQPGIYVGIDGGAQSDTDTGSGAPPAPALQIGIVHGAATGLSLALLAAHSILTHQWGLSHPLPALPDEPEPPSAEEVSTGQALQLEVLETAQAKAQADATIRLIVSLAASLPRSDEAPSSAEQRAFVLLEAQRLGMIWPARQGQAPVAQLMTLASAPMAQAPAVLMAPAAAPWPQPELRQPLEQQQPWPQQSERQAPAPPPPQWLWLRRDTAARQDADPWARSESAGLDELLLGAGAPGVQ